MLKEVNGKILPKGWILEYLHRDKEGITGNLGVLCEDASCGIFQDKKVKDVINGSWSSWWPGETEGNWREAFIRLTFALDDKDLMKDTKEYIESILKYQEQDGYIGIFQPNERFGNGERSGELWTQSRIMNCLLVYYENTKDNRVLEAMERLTDLIVTKYGPLAENRSLYQIPDGDGSKTHSLMVIEPILVMYDYLKKPEYLAFCEFLYDDFSKYSEEAKFPCYDLSRHLATNPQIPFVGHGPHTSEHLRIPMQLYKATGNPLYYTIYTSAFEKLKRYLSISGSCKSDELIGAYQGKITEDKDGKLNMGQCYPIPGTGYEYCSTTELMFSFNEGLQITGNLEYADYEEWMIMNAAMAARRPDGKAILYLCSDNLYKAAKAVGTRWDYSPTHTDAAVCCAPNSCKVMPYHLSNMWKTDANNDLHAVYYGPCTLKTMVGNINVKIDENTRYPFENHVEFNIESDGDFQNSLYFRVPAWSLATVIYYNGEKITGDMVQAGMGRAIRLEHNFRNGDCIEVTFSSEPRLVKAVDGTMAVTNGPLLYSMDIPAVAEDYFHYDLEPFCDTDYLPEKNADWNYTLLYNESRPEDYFRITHNDVNEFEWDKPPVTMEAKMLSSWAIPEWKKLVPIGCTTLRRTTFPIVLDIYKY
jgi:hypothetical protein